MKGDMLRWADNFVAAAMKYDNMMPKECPETVSGCEKCFVECEHNERIAHPADTDCFATANQNKLEGVLDGEGAKCCSLGDGE